MYVVHPDLRQPAPDAKLWRYMNLAGLVSLMTGKQLFFSKLKYLKDPYEGAPTGPTLRALRKLRFQQQITREEKATVDAWKMQMESCRARVCVNCWHASEYESEAMWQLYGWFGENVCIVSDLSRMQECFKENPTEITGALVDYEGDRDGEFRLQRPESWMYARATRKRKSYEHEREFRLLHLQGDANVSRGTYFAVDPTVLVAEIWHSPGMPDWQVLTLQNLMGALGYSFPIRQPTLLIGPFDPIPWHGQRVVP